MGHLSSSRWRFAKRSLLYSITWLSALWGLTRQAHADPGTFDGGSSDILQVRSEDAAIVAQPDPTLLKIVLEDEIFEDLWTGVLDGTFQYLQIESCRFFVNHSPAENTLYGYDWLGLQYTIVPRSQNVKTRAW